MRQHAPLPLVGLALLLGAACVSGVRPVPGRDPDTGPRPRLGTSRGGVGTTPLNPGSREPVVRGQPVDDGTGLVERRVCRSGARPTGWIAVAYQRTNGDECPARTGNASGGIAVLDRISHLHIGAMLDVCADQQVPTDWVDDHAVDVDAGQCPGAGPNGVSATRRIRRVR